MGDVDGFLAQHGVEILDLTPEEEMNSFLAHYGIKGMRWGIRRTQAQLHAGTSEDAIRANEIRAKVQTQGLSSLSNQEMQHLVQRMNLEQQYARVTYQPSKIARGKAQVDTFLQTANTVNSAIKFVNSPAGKIMMEKAFPNKREGGPPKHYKEPKKKGKKK